MSKPDLNELKELLVKAYAVHGELVNAMFARGLEEPEEALLHVLRCTVDHWEAQESDIINPRPSELEQQMTELAKSTAYAFAEMDAWADKTIAHFDDLFGRGQFKQADEELAGYDVAKLGTYEVVTLLSATLPGAGKLPSRPALFERCYERLLELAPNRADALVQGLEGRIAGGGE